MNASLLTLVQNPVYDCAVSKEMGLKSPATSGCRTRQSMRHFYARAFLFEGRGCDGYNTRKGKKSAKLVLGFEPPAASVAALKTLRRGFVSLDKERSMSQSILTIGETSVRQLDGLFSLNDLHAAAGGEAKHEPNQFTRLDQTQALIAEIKSADSRICIETKRGAKGGTYACRELVIAYAAWISAAFHLKVIRVFLARQQAPALPYSVAPGQTLSEEQAATLRGMLDEACKALAKDLQPMFMMQGWSKLKAHFGVGYRQIPAHEFTEAVSLVSRHIVSFNGTKVLQEPQPVTTASLVNLLSGDLLSERAVLDIAMASTQTLLKNAGKKPNGYGAEVRSNITSQLPLADLHTILMAASTEMYLRTIGAKLAMEKSA